MKTSLISISALLSASFTSVGAVRGLTRKNARVLKGTAPQEACARAADEADDNFMCACEDLATNETALVCVNTCEYCTQNETICGSDGFDQVFDVEGVPSMFEDSWAYSRGREEVVSIATSDCSLDEEGRSVCDSCEVTIDDVACASCTMENCTLSGSALKLPVFDCTNIDGGITLDFCSENITVDSTELFGFLATGEGVFDECIEKTMMPSDTPSDFPSGEPSNIPSDMPSMAPSGPTMSPRPTAMTVPTLMPVAETIPATDAPVMASAPTEAPVAGGTTEAPVDDKAPVSSPTVDETEPPAADPTFAPVDDSSQQTPSSSAVRSGVIISFLALFVVLV